MSSNNSSYLDIELYMNYCFLIVENNNLSFLSCICDNIIDSDKIYDPKYFSYMYRININKFENIDYKRYYNNDDFEIPNDEIQLNYNLLYIVYYIKNNNLYPINVIDNLVSAKNDLDKYKYDVIYLAGLKTNKVYNSIYDYEYFYIFMK